MIILSKNFFFIKKHIIWFPSDDSNFNLNSGITYIRQHNFNLNSKYIIYEDKFLTSHIYLDKPSEIIYNKFKATTKYDIRKANKLNFTFEKIDKNNIGELDNFFTEVKKFYIKRKLQNTLNYQNYQNLPINNLILFKISESDNWHTYALFIYDNKRFRLLVLINNYSNIKSNLLGYSSKLLIWKCIEYAKKINCKIFDLGGLSQDINFEGINKFKLSFGGSVINEKNTLYCKSFYIRLFYFLSKKILK